MSELLLESTIPFDYQIDEKAEGGIKRLYVEGIYQKWDAENENGRIYPKRILDREVKSLQGIISERRLMGEMNHPTSSEINPERSCHLVIILESKSDDGIVFGKSQILEGTPFGDLYAGLVRNKVKMGISSRGKGTVSYKNGLNEVNDDYKMITFDVVSRPSTPGAYPNAIMESKKEDGVYYSLNDLTEKILAGELTSKDVVEIMTWKPGTKKIFI